MLLRIAILGAASALTACVSQGPTITQAQVDTMMASRPACADVMASLGRPAAYVNASGNREAVFYTDHIIHSGPERLIPVAGPLIGGIDAWTNMLVFTCDENGRVAEYQFGDVVDVAASRYTQAR